MRRLPRCARRLRRAEAPIYESEVETSAAVIAPVHVGVDATSWSNDRGFGRFTRRMLTALAARDSGFRYTLLFDREPADALPAGVDVLCAATQRTLGESAVGS